MSLTTYIHMDSTFRNRKDYPSQFDFVMHEQYCGDNKRIFDPVSKAAPEKTWVSNQFETSTNSPTLDAEVITIDSFGVSGNGILHIRTRNSLTGQRGTDYYAGATLHKDSNGSYSVRILSSEFLYVDNTNHEVYKITVDGNLSGVTSGEHVTIHDPSNFADVNNGVLFVPTGNVHENRYTADYKIYNYTRKLDGGSNYVYPIRRYFGELRILIPDGDITGWNVTDRFAIRKEEPFESGVKLNGVNGDSPPTYEVTNSSDTFFQLPLNITGVDTTMYLYVVDGTEAGEFRKISKVYEQRNLGLILGAGNGTTTFEVPPGTDIVVNTHIHITSGAAANQVRQIVNFDSTTNLVTVSPAFDGAVAVVDGDGFEILTVKVDKPFNSAIPGGTGFEIWKVNCDNYRGFYTYSQLTNPLCTKIRLVHLILPNVLLRGSLGGMIPSYPYVLVTLENNPSSHSGNNITQSNNCNGRTALFQVSLDDCSRPCSSSYLKIKGDGECQTVNFKLNDSIRIRVQFPDGTTLGTFTVDRSSPYETIPEIQMSALFEITEH